MKKTFIALAVCQTISGVAWAEEANEQGGNSILGLTPTQQEADEQNSTELETVIVTASPFSQKTGTQTLTAEQIKKRPKGNSNITELLRDNPSVQFDNASNLSAMGGELEPARISFHGEKYYNNNFMIDGLSNNNNIDPASNNAIAALSPNGQNPWDLPSGGEQSLWIDSSLIGSLEVFDSNISAKYGNFTGGVLDAKIKNPDTKRASGRVSYRTTRDNWTKFHLDDEHREKFESASELYYQPQFTKNFYSVSVNQPLSEKAALLFSYNREESKIPYFSSYLKDWKKQKRLSETFLLKGLYKADNGDVVTATAMYAPHKSRFYFPNRKDGMYENEGGGYRVNLDWDHLAEWGKVNSVIGYQYDENTFDYEADYYYPWYHKYRGTTSSVINWASAVENSVGSQTALQGGYGKVTTKKKTFTLKQDYNLLDFDFGISNHRLNLGWEYNLERANYQRHRDTYMYATPTWNTSVVCAAGDSACINGEQYLAIRLYYPARGVRATMNRYAAYLEDIIKLGRLEITPGVRIAYDDFMKNTNISPRLAFTLDTFDDEKTRIFGGYNRYHANNIFAYKLKNGISTNFMERRSLQGSTLTDWSVNGDVRELSSSKYNHDVSNLKTPYSDELNIGVAQQIANSLWTLKYVHRDSKRSFARSTTTNEKGERIMDNSGWSKAHTLTLNIKNTAPIELAYLNMDWALNAQWTKHKQNSVNTYDSTSEADQEYAIFDGKLMQKGDLPAFNFYTPWSISTTIDLHFPKLNLDWGHRIGFNAGHKSYLTERVTCPAYGNSCGGYSGDATLYTKHKYKNYWSYDWHFAYIQPTFSNQSLEITLDVVNVLNKRVVAYNDSAVGGSNVTGVNYKLGRQFWFGMAYNW